MANNIFTVSRNIESLEEIVNEVPKECTIFKCIGKGLRSLRGIEKLPQIVKLYVYNNQIQSLEHLAESNVAKLYISHNQIQSLEGIFGSNVTKLNISFNQIRSLEYLSGSNVTELIIYNNKIQSLEGIPGSNVTKLDISNNPCYDEFVDLGESIENVRKKYWFPEIKEPSEEYS